MVGAVLVSGLMLVDRDGPTAPPHPTVWDPRVSDLVAFVEADRGLTFDHPVFIDFLPAAEIAAARRAAAAAPTGAEYEAAAIQVSQLRALGLVSGDLDLLSSSGELSAEGVVAWYDPIAERIVAPDGDLGPQQRATLVHELAHALQDQAFDLEAQQAAAPAPVTFRALAEGDASRIEQRYVDLLPEADRAQYASGTVADADRYEAAVATIAPTLGALQLAPYVLGEGMVDTLLGFDEQVGLDGAFRRPPCSDEALFDPGHYRGNGTVLGAQAPSVVAGETVVDEGTLGPLTWFLMLAESTDLGTALHAAYGWGGDAYVMVQDGEQNCMRIAYRADSAADLREMQGALDRWATAAPGVRREVSAVGEQLVVTACDPGIDVAIPLNGTPADALVAPRTVMDLANELHTGGGLPYQRARCIGIGFAVQYGAAELAELARTPAATDEQVATRDARLASASASCP